MRKNITAMLCLALAGTSAAAIAKDETKASVELGMIFTSGNTETESTNAKAKVEKTKDKWRGGASLEALNVKGEEGRLSEKYLGAGKVSYLFSERSYAFVSANGEHDPFSGYSYQVSGAAGYGFRALDKEAMFLDLEVGPGYRQVKIRNTGDEEGDAILRLFGNFEWSISETAKLTEELAIETDGDLTISKSITALTAQIDSNLAMKLSFTAKHTSETPDEIEEWDTETGVTLVYNF